MKSFSQYLLIEAKDRFIKGNKNLTKEQQKEIIAFFKANRQAETVVEKLYGWQKRAKDLTYDQFTDIMIKFRSGRKKVLKHQNISGLKLNEHYVHLRMPTKEFLAYIPLTYEAAQKFNSRALGICSGPWCIGHSDSDPQYWNSEVIEDQQVPVYIVNEFSKWVVMIQDDNRNYDVWSVENNPKKIHEGIPGFSVRKNLLSSKQKALYDEIREDFYDEETETPEIDVDDAIVDYDALVSDMNQAASDYQYAGENIRDENERIKEETKDKYIEEAEEAQEEHDKMTALIDEGEAIRDELDERRDEWIEEDEVGDEPTADFNGESDLTVDEIQDRIDRIDSDRDTAYDEINNAEYNAKKIDEIGYYEMEEYDIDWTDNPISEEDAYDDIHFPSIEDDRYADYLELAETHMGFSPRHSDINSSIYEYIIESEYSNKYPEEVLSEEGLYHPDYVNER